MECAVVVDTRQKFPLSPRAWGLCAGRSMTWAATLYLKVATQPVQQDRDSMAQRGWRLPFAWRKSGMSAKTSMRGWGCGIMMIDLVKGFWFMGGVLAKQGPTWDKTL